MPPVDPTTLGSLLKSPRPTSLSPEAQSIILDRLARRQTMKDACEAAGITYNGFCWWRKRWTSGDPKAEKFGDFFRSIIPLIPTIVSDPPTVPKRSREWKRMRRAVTSLMGYHLGRHRIGKTIRTATILTKHLGYSPDDLIAHLERNFSPGMTWGNYGQWHVDHKIPASWFDYTSMEDDGFRACWSLSNLQPKWANENASKSNRYAE